jgi:hypothetical protein
MTAQPTMSVRTWMQAARDAQRYGEIRQIILAYIHPDSPMSRDEALDRIVRIVDTDDSPTQVGGAIVGTWSR